MELKNLVTFIQVAESGSFTKAAKILGYSQSTVSFQIGQLETELQIRLFDRIHHTVSLTEGGKRILSCAHEMTRLAEEMTMPAGEKRPVKGHVRIAMADSLCRHLLGAVFARLQSRYPAITLKVVSGDTNEMFRLLNHNEVDLVFTLDNHIYNREYVIAGEEKIPMHFVVPVGHALAGRERVSVYELTDYPFLLTEKGMSYRRLLEERLAALSLEVTPVLELGNAEILCRLVAEGTGLSFLPDFTTARYVQAGTIRRLTVPDCEVAVWGQLLYHRDKWLTPQIRAVAERFLLQMPEIGGG